MKLLARNLRFQILSLACVAVFFGFARGGSPPQDASTEKVTVIVKNVVFEPKEITIKPGTTVEWTDEGGRHTVEADDGSFKSPTLIAGQKFEHTFDKPGAFPYFCGVHGSKGGHNMSGKVIVEAK